jgi:hypothetical protein
LAETPEVQIPFWKATLSTFDGLINGSKRLAIYELRQLETRPDTEITFLAAPTFLYKIGSWRNFAMTPQETLHTKNVANELSLPLVTHTTHFDIRFGCYGILNLL